MSEKSQREMRNFGIAGTVGIWGTIGLVLLLRTIKDLATGSPIELRFAVLLAAALITVVGTILGDATRHAVGLLWLIVAMLGFLFFVVGVGLEIEWIGSMSIYMLFSGLVTAYLIFLPDRKP